MFPNRKVNLWKQLCDVKPAMPSLDSEIQGWSWMPKPSPHSYSFEKEECIRPWQAVDSDNAKGQKILYNFSVGSTAKVGQTNLHKKVKVVKAECEDAASFLWMTCSRKVDDTWEFSKFSVCYTLILCIIFPFLLWSYFPGSFHFAHHKLCCVHWVMGLCFQKGCQSQLFSCSNDMISSVFYCKVLI